jgi:hypothetical protein
MDRAVDCDAKLASRVLHASCEEEAKRMSPWISSVEVDMIAESIAASC